MTTADTELICHLVAAADWAAGTAGYRPASLDTEGFMHFSTPEQVVETANLFYAGRDDLLLLVVDPSRLTGELRWEAPAGAAHRDGQLFPHLYGPAVHGPADQGRADQGGPPAARRNDDRAAVGPVLDEDAVLAVHPFPLPPGGLFIRLPEPLVPTTGG